MVKQQLETRLKIIRLGHALHGQRGEEHYYFDDIWCLHLYRNAFELRVNDQRYSIKPGDISLIPPTSQMHYHFSHQEYRHYYCLFSSDVEHHSFSRSPHIRLHPEALQTCTHLFRSAINGQHLGQERCHSAINELLWQIQCNTDLGRLSPVHQAQHIIAASINHDLQVSHIAKEIGISGNQLTRLFHKELGMTVIAYIREQRMQVAKRLIQETDLPIKRIAQECGMQDLQYFNKTVRQFFNCSPRQLRQ